MPALDPAIAPPSPIEGAAAARSARTGVSAEPLDGSFLESLVGYNARRASLSLVAVFAQAVGEHDLKVVEFSMLSLIKSNPGITSRQLCQCLGLLPPNVVQLVGKLIALGHIRKQPLAHDRRAVGLYMTAPGLALTAHLEASICEAENHYLQKLSPKERAQLIKLLQKTYTA